ncbi:MAG: poly-beta-1,6-N-acetyl-D-glucosamine biosynthesis protein PgaD [Sulfuricurvum sp.]|jgi:biofilm PGA synthesis protein PgaD|uniref:poly-beta-1,6-N-acetyl-D-glucosamine biosynthesis protein PgaD n=1 Tax=Sulfuricurvum sp. TaxID=2025608 RepID=UPI0025FD5BBA|nr:poly-beta-1,6-N-acetyl-D-glucosamine biosynthesis protein PgaD [Sulfuricurvum sp.]MCK9373823.1 poly-beta-1,6-N-acetyl-D-glucosamine biosynthesis protein PgaD [Sulfuricurvum sp.]
METLIINKRHDLPRSKRIIWDAATVALWLGFLYLWKPLLIVFYRIITLETQPGEISDWIYENISSVTFSHAVYMLLGTPIVLFILSRLNRHQAPSEHLVYESSDYVGYFQLKKSELQQCLNSQLVTVHHDDHGHIIRLDDQIV